LERVLEAFRENDLLIAPATPVTAPLLGQKTVEIGGREVPLRPNLAFFAQPFSCIGLPVLTVPVFLKESLPIGVQLIAPPWWENISFKVAAYLEKERVVSANRPHKSSVR
jgi:1-carboxybiuret hydrolase